MSTNSSSSSASSPSATVTSISSMAGSSISLSATHSVTVKLGKDNYLLWRAQFLPYLRSTGLMGYVDGSTVEPRKQIATTTDSGATQAPNPAWDAWYTKDQAVLTSILSSLSEEMLSHVMTCDTAQEAWKALQNLFALRSRARILNIHMQLANIKKKDMSVMEYYRQVRSLADTLAAVGKPLKEDEIVSYLLTGLGPDYESLVTSLTTQHDDLTLEEVYSHLMSLEVRRETYQSQSQINLGGSGSSANFAGRGQGRGQNRGGGQRGGGRAPGGRGNTNNKKNGGQGRGRPTGPPCQVCGKTGHTAIRCWHRYDEDYNEEPTTALTASSTPSYQVDPSSISDTGATDHITSDLDRLTTREKYHGNDQVQVGNGTGVEEKNLPRKM